MTKEWVANLLTLSDEDWCQYVFNRDPLIGRISPENRLEFCGKAMECGVEQARDIRSEYGMLQKEALAELFGLKLIFEKGAGVARNSMFAFYREPDTIVLGMDNAEATDTLLQEEGLDQSMGGVKSSDLLFAHELFHHLERIRPGLYTTKKLVTLWKIGSFEYRSRILCLEEIGAMAFARELTGLRCSPYIFNVLMLVPVDMKKAKGLYENYMKFKRGRSFR